MYYRATEGSDIFPGFQQAKKQKIPNWLRCATDILIFREIQSLYICVTAGYIIYSAWLQNENVGTDLCSKL